MLLVLWPECMLIVFLNILIKIYNLHLKCSTLLPDYNHSTMLLKFWGKEKYKLFFLEIHNIHNFLALFASG